MIYGYFTGYDDCFFCWDDLEIWIEIWLGFPIHGSIWNHGGALHGRWHWIHPQRGGLRIGSSWNILDGSGSKMTGYVLPGLVNVSKKVWKITCFFIGKFTTVVHTSSNSMAIGRTCALWSTNSLLLNMAPLKNPWNMVIVQSYVNVYQRVMAFVCFCVGFMLKIMMQKAGEMAFFTEGLG